MINDFYKIISHTHTDPNHHQFEVELNQQCVVYQGHFPERPIAPGVCNIEMIKECAIQAIDSSNRLRIENIRSCQMMEVVDPFKTPQLSLAIEIKNDDESKYEFIGELFNESTSYMKMKATLINY